MAEQRDRIGKRQAGEQSPQSHGWRVRAAQTYGDLSPVPSWTLSASEIGAYAFCPQAWCLQRCRLPVKAEAAARRWAGSQTHREIGRQTDLMPTANALQAVILIAIGVMLLLLATLPLRGLA